VRWRGDHDRRCGDGRITFLLLRFADFYNRRGVRRGRRRFGRRSLRSKYPPAFFLCGLLLRRRFDCLRRGRGRRGWAGTLRQPLDRDYGNENYRETDEKMMEAHDAMLRRLRAAGEEKNIFSRKILSARQISCAIGDSLRSKVLAAGWDSRIRKLEIGSLEPSSIVTSSINFPVPKKSIARRAPRLEALIYEIRGQRVMLDSDLAKFYGVPTSRFNEAITRNRERLRFHRGSEAFTRLPLPRS